MMKGMESASPTNGASAPRDIDRSAELTLSAKPGISATSTTSMSESFPSLWAVAYATAPMLRIPPMHREPSESQGGEPMTTLSAMRAGTFSCERSSSASRLSKSSGSVAF